MTFEIRCSSTEYIPVAPQSLSVDLRALYVSSSPLQMGKLRHFTSLCLNQDHPAAPLGTKSWSSETQSSALPIRLPCLQPRLGPPLCQAWHRHRERDNPCPAWLTTKIQQLWDGAENIQAESEWSNRLQTSGKGVGQKRRQREGTMPRYQMSGFCRSSAPEAGLSGAESLDCFIDTHQSWSRGAHKQHAGHFFPGTSAQHQCLAPTNQFHSEPKAESKHSCCILYPS